MGASSRKARLSETGDTPQSRAARVRRLLAWYDRHRRKLPWRAHPGQVADPYRVWLSEIMLQQTTVAAVGPYYVAFLKRWPTVKALAAAPVEEVMSAWAGLGYYSRARNLHACARHVAEKFGGKFPDAEDDLRALPGIGPYTASAIAAIAFGKRAAPVDANIERVLARLYAVRKPLPGAKPVLRALASALAPKERAGDFAQAMMDLGSMICTPKAPDCPSCPWTDDCAGRALGLAPVLPYRDAKAERPLRRGAAFVVISTDDAVLLRRRPPRGLLGGMHEPPMSAWETDFPPNTKAAPLKASFRKLPGLVRHSFTHFELELEVYRAENITSSSAPSGTEWAPLDELKRFALPTVMKKVIAHATADRDAGPLFERQSFLRAGKEIEPRSSRSRRVR